MDSAVRAGGAYFVAVGLCLLILALLLGPSAFDFSIPLVYRDDALFTHALAKTLVENPWCSANPALGAPGVMELYDFPMSDGLHFLWLKGLALLHPNWPGVVNAYFLLTFPLTTLTSLFAMRRLGVTSPPAVVGSLLFAFLPYHLIRSQAHLLLAAYYVVPLSALAAVWVYFGELPAHSRSESPKRPWRRRLALAGVCLLQASAGIYYAAFACFLMLVAGIAGGIERRRLQPLAVAGLLIALTAAGVAANVAPTLVYWARLGRNPEVAQRPVYHAELFGLKIAQLVLPTPGHRWKPLAELRDRYHHSSLAPNENDSVTLGTVGAFGFAALLFRALFMRRREHDLLDALSKLNLACVLLATIGGFGVMFNLLVDPSIRCYIVATTGSAYFSASSPSRPPHV
jgi:phosphoglycerol transferase